MLKLSGRENFFFILTLVITIVALGYSYAVKPFVVLIRDKHDAIDRTELAIHKNERIIALEDNIRKKYDELKEKIKMSGSDETRIMFSAVDGLAGQYRIQISDIKPMEGAERDYYTEYYIRVEGDARMEDLVNFIYDLESWQYVMHVEKLRISARNRPGLGGDGVNFSMVIRRTRVP